MVSDKQEKQYSIRHPNMGDRIDYLLKRRSLSQTGASIACGYSVSSGMMSQIISGDTGMAEDKFIKLCKYLGVDPDAFKLSFSFKEEELEFVITCVDAIKNREQIQHFEAAMTLIKHGLSNLPKNARK